MVRLAEAHSPNLVSEATTQFQRFNKLFALFAECHKIYDSSYVTDVKIAELGR